MAASTTAASSASARGYPEAIEALNSLQSNAATIAAIRASGGKLNDMAIPEMLEYLARIGYAADDLNRLNIVHITGTKGKGSTAAFSSELLLAAFKTESTASASSSTAAGATDATGATGPTVGLYTSPHMMLVRERIRLDGAPVSESTFASSFWHVWDRLGATADQRARPDLTPVRPVYFRFLTLLAFHIFLQCPTLRAVVLEVGIGGKYDSTNIVPRPRCCGVTTLGLDHTALLGNTIEEIAAQKAGIYKEECPALGVCQLKTSAEEVLRDVAQQVGAKPFKLLPRPNDSLRALPLGLPGPHQVTNAHLALELVDAFLAGEKVAAKTPVTHPTRLSVWQDAAAQTPADWARKALFNARWPGRCQVVPVPASPTTKSVGAAPSATTFFLDGAHTTDSLALCTRWFVRASSERHCSRSRTQPVRRTLIFNCTNGRSAQELLESLLSTIAESAPDAEVPPASSPASYFSHVLFCTNVTYAAGRWAGDLTSKAVDPADLDAMAVQRDLAQAWGALTQQGQGVSEGGSEGEGGSAAQVSVLPSIEEALGVVFASREEDEGETQTQTPQHHHVLVAGSLHLVGGVMSHLKDRGALDERLEAVIGNEKVRV